MSVLKVTYLTLPDKSGGQLMNVGDRVIYRGVRNIMLAAIGPHEERTRYISDQEPLPADTDIVVVCGTPQILHTSDPTRSLLRIAEVGQSRVPVKINLGAGAFYFDAFGEDRSVSDAAFGERVATSPPGEHYRRYAGFDLMTCRDMAGSAVMARLGVPHTPMPCPGFFSALFEPRPLFRRPQQLVSVLNGTASFWNRVDADLHRFYRRLYDADPTRIFIAHDEQDVEMLDELGIPHVVFDDAAPFIRYLATADSLISLRVHGALPAWTLGLDVTLMGLDRRALLGADFGAQFRVVPLRTEADFDTVLATPVPGAVQDDATRRAFFQRYMDRYVGMIRETVERKLGRPVPRGVPLHGSGAPEPAEPRHGAPTGRYFRGMFHSQQPEFRVETSLLRSKHSPQPAGAALRLTVAPEPPTLMFGPYIRIPGGRWTLEVELQFEQVPENPNKPNSILPPVAWAEALVLKVMKGIPGKELGRAALPVEGLAAGQTHTLSISFDNPRDTGELETVLMLRNGPFTGAVFRVGPPRLVRQEAAALSAS